MQYVIAFLEGIITFISPCLLPMLPIYLSYFAGGGERSLGRTLRSAFGFVTGFTLVFTALGALAGTVGGFLQEHQTAVNLVSGGASARPPPCAPAGRPASGPSREKRPRRASSPRKT